MIPVLSLVAAANIFPPEAQACGYRNCGFAAYAHLAPPAYYYSYRPSLPPTTPVARRLLANCRTRSSVICTGQPARTYGYFYQSPSYGYLGGGARRRVWEWRGWAYRGQTTW